MQISINSFYGEISERLKVTDTIWTLQKIAKISTVELYGSDIKKAYHVVGIPLWVASINNLILDFIHLFIMSLVVFFIAPLAFNAKTPANLALYFLSLAIFIIVCLAVGIILGLFIKSTSKLTMA